MAVGKGEAFDVLLYLTPDIDTGLVAARQVARQGSWAERVAAVGAKQDIVDWVQGNQMAPGLRDRLGTWSVLAGPFALCGYWRR
jgi:hypothetical protein